MEVADGVEGGVVSDTDMMEGGGCRGGDGIHGVILTVFKGRGGEVITLLAAENEQEKEDRHGISEERGGHIEEGTEALRE